LDGHGTNSLLMSAGLLDSSVALSGAYGLSFQSILDSLIGGLMKFSAARPSRSAVTEWLYPFPSLTTSPRFQLPAIATPRSTSTRWTRVSLQRARNSNARGKFCRTTSARSRVWTEIGQWSTEDTWLTGCYLLDMALDYLLGLLPHSRFVRSRNRLSG